MARFHSMLIFILVQIAALSANDSAKIEQIRLKVDSLELKILELKEILQRLEHGPGNVPAHLTPGQPIIPFDHLTTPTCLSAKQANVPSGKITLPLPGSDRNEEFSAYCDQDTAGGGWLVIQNRIDGSLSFEQTWNAYETGFGEGDKNFWIGLKVLHRLTAYEPYELRVELKDYDGSAKYAEFKDFEVGSALENYKLKKLGSYTGTAGNSLSYHVGSYFSTYDKDNDIHSDVNCASETRGGWWHKYCRRNHYSNLNGVYGGSSQQSIVWWYYKESYSGLKNSRMMIRPKCPRHRL